MANPTSDGVIVIGCDLVNQDLTEMVIALQRAGKLEIVECIHAEPGSSREDEIKELVKNFPALEKPLPLPSASPYWRRFERKRRAR